MKKILLLGGSAQQIIAIEAAKRLGYYTVLCDYLTDNPGRYLSDKFYLRSTTDKETILNIAKEERVDGVVAYASEPAALTSAYVSENLGLPGNPYKSVEILCNKDKFREFLTIHGFFTPKARSYGAVEAAFDDINGDIFQSSVIVKPVDSSGSKGVSRIKKGESQNAIVQKLENAMDYSRRKCIIVEEFVEKYGYQIAGDGLSVNGRLVFRCFGNDHFDIHAPNPFVPVAASFPYNMPDIVQEKIHLEIQRLLTLLGMKTCTYNFDLRIDKDYNVYLMEVAPRNGGNYIPQVIQYATGVDLVECAIKAATGEDLSYITSGIQKGFWSYYAVHSNYGGILDQVVLGDSVRQNNIVDNYIKKKKGDEMNAFTGAGDTLGCLIMKFESMNQMLEMMDNSNKWIKVRRK